MLVKTNRAGQNYWSSAAHCEYNWIQKEINFDPTFHWHIRVIPIRKSFFFALASVEVTCINAMALSALKPRKLTCANWQYWLLYKAVGAQHLHCKWVCVSLMWYSGVQWRWWRICLDIVLPTCHASCQFFNEWCGPDNRRACHDCSLRPLILVSDRMNTRLFWCGQ